MWAALAYMVGGFRSQVVVWDPQRCQVEKQDLWSPLICLVLPFPECPEGDSSSAHYVVSPCSFHSIPLPRTAPPAWACRKWRCSRGWRTPAEMQHKTGVWVSGEEEPALGMRPSADCHWTLAVCGVVGGKTLSAGSGQCVVIAVSMQTRRSADSLCFNKRK